jgi:hypothetical protein
MRARRIYFQSADKSIQAATGHKIRHSALSNVIHEFLISQGRCYASILAIKKAA